MTWLSLRTTVEPGMSRTSSPPRIPVASPFGATTTASRASSRTNSSVACGIATGGCGFAPFAVIDVPLPAVTVTGADAPSSVPVVFTTPSVAVTIVLTLIAWIAGIANWSR